MENYRYKFRAWDGVAMRDWDVTSDFNDDDAYIPGAKDRREGSYESRMCGIGVVTYGEFTSSHEAGHSRDHMHIGFYVESKGEQVWDGCSEDIDWSRVFIIGNIYENPELLEDKNSYEQ